MIKFIPYSIREKLRKIEWLVRFYRRYFMKLPIDGGYSEMQAAQDRILAKLNTSKLSTLFSIVVPTYQPDISLFKDMVNSVFAQSYPHWQLVIIDDASVCDELSYYLNELECDPRICIVRRAENGHISNASNDGLTLADGEFVVLLDHDDLLHQDALTAMVNGIDRNPQANILYSDEDKINGQR